MTKKFPLNPAHPERTCWGCDLYCPSDSMRCGNGSERTQHPAELFGEDWMSFGLDARDEASAPAPGSGAAARALTPASIPVSPIRIQRRAPPRDAASTAVSEPTSPEG